MYILLTSWLPLFTISSEQPDIEDSQPQASDQTGSTFDPDEESAPQDSFDAESTLSSDDPEDTAESVVFVDFESTLSSDQADESQLQASVESSSRLNSQDLVAFANRYDITQGDDIVSYKLPWWHPEIEWAIMSEVGGPDFHPWLDNDPEFQRFIRANTDENHQFLDPDTECTYRCPHHHCALYLTRPPLT